MAYDIASWLIGGHGSLEGKEINGEAIVVARGGDRPVVTLGWKGHLYAPAEPLHPTIVAYIAASAARLASTAYERGYAQAQTDIRKALGVPVR